MRQFLAWFVIPMVFVIVVVTALFVAGYPKDAVIVGDFGIGLVLFVTLVHMIFFDSRKHWPGLPWHRRMDKIFSFQR